MGDGVLVEFPSIVAAVECAVADPEDMAELNTTPGGQAHPLPHRRQSRRRAGRGRRHPGRRSEHRGAARRNLRARRHLSVAGSAYEHVGGRIAAEFVEIGEKSLKNIAKPVRAYTPPEASLGEAPAIVRRKRCPRRRRALLVVLPFANIGGGSEQEYFVDGVTESLTTDLSRISGAFVIGRSTAFTYKGKAVDLKQIGRELNVRYVLEGSVQRGGDRMRVNVQLSRPRAARTCGPSASTSRSPTSSRCRTRLSRGSPTRLSDASSPRSKLGARSAAPNPDRHRPETLRAVRLVRRGHQCADDLEAARVLVRARASARSGRRHMRSLA